MGRLGWLLHPVGRRLRRLDLPLLASSGGLERPDVIADLVRAYDLEFAERVGIAYVADAQRKVDRGDGLAQLQRDVVLSDPPTESQRRLTQFLAWRLVLLRTAPPSAALDVAAQRLERLVPAFGARLVLALVRLRQGRWHEVEPLCRAEIAGFPDLPGTNTQLRATALAAIAIARHALGQDAVAPALEAAEIEPDAELVDEALRVSGVEEQRSS